MSALLSIPVGAYWWDDPWLHGLALGFIIANVLLGITGWAIWYERKFAGRMQNRPGPTEVGIFGFGLLQPLADAFKMLQKEHVVPRAADRPMFEIAPVALVALALTTVAVVPFDAGLIIADLHIGVLFALAVGSLMVLPTWMAGWSSNNKYALLAGMRAAAQAISYEIPLLLAATVPIILTGSLRLGDIVDAQEHGWFVFWPIGPGAVAFVLFMLCSLAEANRIPFDIPEAESELVSGVSVEYGGIRFGLFHLAEYMHTLIASALASAMFLGGWHGPLGSLAGGGPEWISSGLHWMVAKTLFLYAFIFLLRWSWMRFRSDQLMSLCWRYLVPLGLVLVVVSASWVVVIDS